jgi:hypothetical protein
MVVSVDKSRRDDHASRIDHTSIARNSDLTTPSDGNDLVTFDYYYGVSDGSATRAI